MSDLWTEASRDVEAETQFRALSYARATVQPVWPFLAKAASVEEYYHRHSLVANKIDDAAQAATDHTGRSFILVRADLEDSLLADFRTVLASADGACTYCGGAGTAGPVDCPVCGGTGHGGNGEDDEYDGTVEGEDPPCAFCDGYDSGHDPDCPLYKKSSKRVGGKTAADACPKCGSTNLQTQNDKGGGFKRVCSDCGAKVGKPQTNWDDKHNAQSSKTADFGNTMTDAAAPPTQSATPMDQMDGPTNPAAAPAAAPAPATPPMSSKPRTMPAGGAPAAPAGMPAMASKTATKSPEDLVGKQLLGQPGSTITDVQRIWYTGTDPLPSGARDGDARAIVTVQLEDGRTIKIPYINIDDVPAIEKKASLKVKCYTCDTVEQVPLQAIAHGVVCSCGSDDVGLDGEDDFKTSRRVTSSLDDFVGGYIECALWSSVDMDDEEPLDAKYDESDIDPGAMQEIRATCQSFIDMAGDLLDGIDDSQAGHDFWLTRNHHGAGFWDRGLGEVGDKLTEIAHSFGDAEPEVGDDGKLYRFASKKRRTGSLGGGTSSRIATPSTQRYASDDSHKAEPDPTWVIRNSSGNPTQGAQRGDYPLVGRCATCKQTIICADSTADWVHGPEEDTRGSFDIMTVIDPDNALNMWSSPKRGSGSNRRVAYPISGEESCDISQLKRVDPRSLKAGDRVFVPGVGEAYYTSDESDSIAPGMQGIGAGTMGGHFHRVESVDGDTITATVESTGESKSYTIPGGEKLLKYTGSSKMASDDWSGGWARKRERDGGAEDWGTYYTVEGNELKMYRGSGNKVRFYDSSGKQHGDEQGNVAPGMAYAESQGWTDPDSVKDPKNWSKTADTYHRPSSFPLSVNDTGFDIQGKGGYYVMGYAGPSSGPYSTPSEAEQNVKGRGQYVSYLSDGQSNRGKGGTDRFITPSGYRNGDQAFIPGRDMMDNGPSPWTDVRGSSRVTPSFEAKVKQVAAKVLETNPGMTRESALRVARQTVDKFPEMVGTNSAEATLKTAMPAPADLDVNVGDIFYDSWGYDQTNIDFYEVVRLTGAGVEVRPVASKILEANGPGGNKVVPDKGHYISNIFIQDSKVCRLKDWGSPAYIVINRDHSARKWGGNPMYETDSMFGH